MDDQITAGAPGDLHPIGAEPELGGDAYGLAVAIHEHPTAENLHSQTRCVRVCAYMLVEGFGSGNPVAGPQIHPTC